MNSITSNPFVGLSWDPERVGEKARRTLAKLDAIAGDWWRAGHAGRLLCAQPSAFHGSSTAAALCMTAPQTIGQDGRAYGPDALFERFARDGSGDANQMSAPFAAAWIDPRDKALKAATDAYGIGQIFCFESDEISGVSNSATLLARLFGCRLSPQALTGFALFGAFQEADTPFEGVSKVSADQALWFDGARRIVTPTVGVAPTRAASIKDLAESLRATVTRLSDAAPDADLQLSGGLDSRLILAALPPDRRRRHRALTIGPPTSPDVQIAAAITERLGLRHEVINAVAFDSLGADQLHLLFRRAALGFDCSANPVDKVALLLAEQKLPGGSWFNGQNGEILRGFYYPGQPLDAPASPALARRLLSWRIAVNDKVDPRLFPVDTYQTLRGIAEERVVARLLSFDGPWSSALDRFYLLERMQRWAGNGTDNLINRLGYLCPFFDREFVETALQLPAALKLNSRGAYRVLSTLDPDLASLPLDSGVRPLSIVEAPLQAKAAEMMLFAKKAAGRVKRSLARGRRATLGSDSVAQLWLRHGLNTRLPHAALLATGLFDAEALGKIVSGEWLPDRPTLGFVLMAAELSEIS